MELAVNPLEFAVFLANLGYKVFPCNASKKPLTEHGYKDATNDPQAIRKLWAQYPGELVGIACQPSGVFAVDIDCKNGTDGLQSWLELVQACANGSGFVHEGPAQSTPSGGYHLIFKLPAGMTVPNNAGQLAPGIDLRSTGYICTGTGYKQWQEHKISNPPADPPAWLVERIRAMSEKKRAAPATVQPLPTVPADVAAYWYNRFLPDAREGTRNDTLYRMGLQLSWSGVPESEAEALAANFAHATGLPEREALATMNSAYKAPKKDPANIPGLTSPARSNGHQLQEPDYQPPELEELERQAPAEELPAAAAAPGQPAKERRKEPQGAEYVEFLAQRGYTFRLCELDDSLWVNNERMTDPLDAEIKTLLRDNGYPKVNVAADAYLAHARKKSFHPVIDFLESLAWDGQDHISKLAEYVTDKHGNFQMILKRWLIGAVARPLTRGKQNRVLVLEGDQGVGKSFFARWIASPLEEYFSEAMPDPDNKDSRLALATTWIWEIKELGSVTRRSDRESLKAYLTLEGVTERVPFGKYPIHKPAMTSFIATVNDEGGFFNDPTGSRRYMTVAISEIDWNYSKAIDPRQLWAQAMTLYKRGEDWNLTSEEQARIAAVNDEYEFSLPSHDWLDRYIEECPGNFLETETIRRAMAGAGNFGSDTQLGREIAGWMTRHGYEPAKEYVNLNVVNEFGEKATSRRQVRGYKGVKLNRKYAPSYGEQL